MMQVLAHRARAGDQGVSRVDKRALKHLSCPRPAPSDGIAQEPMLGTLLSVVASASLRYCVSGIYFYLGWKGDCVLLKVGPSGA